MPHNLTRPPRGANPTHPASHTRSGHYVPAVANAVFQNNKNLPAGDVWINLQGLAIGNGLTNPLIQYGFYAEQAYTFAQSYLGKPIITLSEYNAMVAAWPACEARIANCQTNTAACAQAVSAPGVVDVTWAGHARAVSSITLARHLAPNSPVPLTGELVQQRDVLRVREHGAGARVCAAGISARRGTVGHWVSRVIAAVSTTGRGALAESPLPAAPRFPVRAGRLRHAPALRALPPVFRHGADDNLAELRAGADGARRDGCHVGAVQQQRQRAGERAQVGGAQCAVPRVIGAHPRAYRLFGRCTVSCSPPTCVFCPVRTPLPSTSRALLSSPLTG